ncbi:MAG: SusC/RagA family TonB-linked outer membrane protein, partial [Marinilabiliaceae bacterium]|nr:SusC/RagA family TonB-linked outer membrane protein [Marinilabiliaceae bacterium]
MRKSTIKHVVKTVTLIVFFTFITGLLNIYAQGIKVSGTVLDEDGLSLPGVTVVVKGQMGGTTSDMDGRYSIEVPSGEAVLQFSFIGMRSLEVPVANRSTIDVTLEYDVIGLEEVVAIGYGTLQKREITNSITSVKADEFVKGAINNVGELVQGKVAGLQITSTSGSPTASPEILLRGVGTLMSGVSPLIIIDGIPGTMNQVAPEDIESIDVLKDGSAAAIYGTRGSNGVILITTKKVHGKTPTTVEVSSHFTTDRITRRLEFLNAQDISDLIADGNIFAVDEGYETDWQDLIYQNPVSENYNISIRSGDSQSSYYANVNYKGTDGLIKRSDNNVLTTRLEFTNSMYDNKLKFNANLIGRLQNYYPGSWNDVYEQAMTRNPTDRPADDDGNWIEYPARNRYENPMAHLYEKEGDVRNTTLKGFGSVSYEILPGLVAKATGSVEDYSSLQGTSWTHDHINNVKNGQEGGASRYTYKSRTKVFESTLQYRKVLFDVHN